MQNKLNIDNKGVVLNKELSQGQRKRLMGKTLIVISHDDHYFEQADQLFQRQEGRLIELTGQNRVDASPDAIAQIT